jgi:DNA-binding XRE family transcriptional regulator
MLLFKTRMRVLPAERELTHAQLAAQVGVTRQTINSIEKARYRGKSGAKLVARFRETMATH